MLDLRLRRFALCVSTVVLLVGCSGSQPHIGSLATTQRDRTLSSRVPHGDSWMLREAKSENLLYISNVDSVTVYSYPKGKLVGTLEGFYRPGGECVDPSGNVYIANLDTFLEYKHGGKKPIKTLTMQGYDAVDCSVDSTTGDLASTWNQSASSENYVAVYKDASGAPTLYGLNHDFIYYCGYDNQGNLFADGQVGYMSSAAVLVELPRGGNKLNSITLNQSFSHVGALQWDGKYLAMGDDDAEKVYRLAIAGSSATVEGTVTLAGTDAVYQWWIDRKRLIGPNGLQNSASFWGYPSGGSPTKTITQGITAPYGATVSSLRKLTWRRRAVH